MKPKYEKCAMCKKQELEMNMFELETPNHIFDICLECGIELEDKIKEAKQ